MTIEVDGSSETQATSFLKRILMRLLLVLIGASVVVAIAQVLFGAPLGVTLGKMIWTSLVAGLYGLCAISCAAAAERKPTFFAFAGVGLVVVTVALFFFGLWFEVKGSGLWKAFTVGSLFGLAFWRCARFTLVMDLGRAGNLVVKATMGACLAIAAVVSLMILRERADTMLVRVMNALWIVCVGGHVAVPVLERLRRPRDD